MERKTASRMVLTLLSISILMLTFNFQRACSQTVHDVAITDVVPLKTVVGQGYSLNISVTVVNQGEFNETFNVELYANTTLIGNQTVNDMQNGTSVSLIFTWNTASFAKSNYTISANATLIPDDNPGNNYLVDDWVKVTIFGDVNGDGLVELMDFFEASIAFGSYPGHPRWNPNCDLYDDSYIECLDFLILCQRFSQQDP